VVIAVAVGLISQIRSASAWPHDGKLHVVAGENFWGNITAQIGGGHIDVTSIISNPNTDPHLYESDAHDAAAIATANIVVENGVGYDDFMDKLMAASPNSQRAVVSAAQVLDVTGNDPNPHLWYNTPKVPKVAAAIAAKLAAADPAHRADYQRNLQQFDASLQPINSVVAEIATKYPGAPVAYTERVPGYLLANADLSVQTPVGFASAVEDGNDPSPADTEAMDSLMTNHRIKVLLYNAQVTSSVTQHVRSLAQQAGIPVIGVTETLPAGQSTYQSWQLDQAKALLTALGG
jgi:zinc/manganese transport system substrate-binding protein